MKKLVLSLLTVVLVSTAVVAQEKEKDDFSKWQVRLRGLLVQPNVSKDKIDAIGGDVQILNRFITELDFTYFFTKNWAAELILGTTQHDVAAKNTSIGDVNLGSVWLLPPTLTLQYHFKGTKAHPYVGAGVNYTFFYNAHEFKPLKDVSYKNAFGIAFQTGLDYDITDKWFLNADIKYILLSTDVTVKVNDATTIGAETAINPLLFGLGVGMRF